MILVIIKIMIFIKWHLWHLWLWLSSWWFSWWWIDENHHRTATPIDNHLPFSMLIMNSYPVPGVPTPISCRKPWCPNSLIRRSFVRRANWRPKQVIQVIQVSLDPVGSGVSLGIQGLSRESKAWLPGLVNLQKTHGNITMFNGIEWDLMGFSLW